MVTASQKVGKKVDHNETLFLSLKRKMEDINFVVLHIFGVTYVQPVQQITEFLRNSMEKFDRGHLTNFWRRKVLVFLRSFWVQLDNSPDRGASAK